MQEREIRVLCVDDNTALVDAMEQALCIEPGIRCVGHLFTADTLVGEVGRLRPDVVLLDIEMPGADSLTMLKELTGAHPETRVVVLSAHVRDDYIDAAINAGAWGYLSKGDGPSEVIRAVRKVARGEFSLGREVAERYIREPGRPATA